MSNFKTACITGATSGIGAATARVLSRSGYKIIASGRREEKLEQLSNELTEAGGDVLGVVGDICSQSTINDVLQSSVTAWGQIPDVFVLCAGRGLPGSMLNSDERQWEELIDVNYLSVMKQLKACTSLFKSEAEKNAKPVVRDIVVIGSTVGRVVSAANPVYGSTKFAVHSLVESLRQELCSYSIRTTLIEPGFVESEFQESAGYDMQWFDSVKEEFGPLLKPVDIAKTIEFVVQQPDHVHLDDIRIRPTRQKV